MNLISVVRDKLEDGRNNVDGWTGRMFLGGLELGFTLERLDKIIIPGVFPLRVHNSPSFGRKTIEIVVPGRRYILIHEVSHPDQLLGCVGLGGEDRPGAEIGKSKPLVRWLEDLVIPQIEKGAQWWCAVHQVPKGP